MYATADGSTNSIACAAGVPSAARPGYDLDHVCIVVDNSVIGSARVSVTPGGDITIYADCATASFAATGVGGFYDLELSWFVKMEIGKY